jgi:hypothetical protein
MGTAYGLQKPGLHWPRSVNCERVNDNQLHTIPLLLQTEMLEDEIRWTRAGGSVGTDLSGRAYGTITMCILPVGTDII